MSERGKQVGMPFLNSVVRGHMSTHMCLIKIISDLHKRNVLCVGSASQMAVGWASTVRETEQGENMLTSFSYRKERDGKRDERDLKAEERSCLFLL